MPLRVGINGFGRIGRCVLRAGWDNPDIEFVHINDLTSADMLAYLLEHDSVHGKWHEVESEDGAFVVGDRKVTISAERDPKDIPWGEKNVDVVLECTGIFRGRTGASAHLDAGAKRVIVSAPGTDVDGTFVMGVNDDQLDPAIHEIISNASCTTNCLAPAALVLENTVGIESATMTTVHSYTMDQNMLDAAHRKGNFRRARAAAINMVPTSTGAAKAIGLVLPQLAGRMNGMAIRVPTADVSIVDLSFIAKRDTTAEELNAAFEAAANGPLKGILAVTRKEVVSSDLIGTSASSTIDLNLTKVIDNRLCKILAWYDNEWGFSCRMIDMALKFQE